MLLTCCRNRRQHSARAADLPRQAFLRGGRRPRRSPRPGAARRHAGRPARARGAEPAARAVRTGVISDLHLSFLFSFSIPSPFCSSLSLHPAPSKPLSLLSLSSSLPFPFPSNPQVYSGVAFSPCHGEVVWSCVLVCMKTTQLIPRLTRDCCIGLRIRELVVAHWESRVFLFSPTGSTTADWPGGKRRRAGRRSSPSVSSSGLGWLGYSSVGHNSVRRPRACDTLRRACGGPEQGEESTEVESRESRESR